MARLNNRWTGTPATTTTTTTATATTIPANAPPNAPASPPAGLAGGVGSEEGGLLRLTPPVDHDYFFNIENSVGISDFYDDMPNAGTCLW